METDADAAEAEMVISVELETPIKSEVKLASTPSFNLAAILNLWRFGDIRMAEFKNRGDAIRVQAMQLVLEFMQNQPKCQTGAEGMKQAIIFRDCGFDWGDYPKTTSSNQQYWIVGLLQELAAEGKVERVSESGPWRLVSDPT